MSEEEAVGEVSTLTTSTTLRMNKRKSKEPLTSKLNESFEEKDDDELITNKKKSRSSPNLSDDDLANVDD